MTNIKGVEMLGGGLMSAKARIRPPKPLSLNNLGIAHEGGRNKSLDTPDCNLSNLSGRTSGKKYDSLFLRSTIISKLNYLNFTFSLDN